MKRAITPWNLTGGITVMIAVTIAVMVVSRQDHDREKGDDTVFDLSTLDTTGRSGVHYKYGIPVDDFEVIEDVVRANESLSVILGRHGVPARKISEMVGRCAGVLDARKIRAGNKYTLFLGNDSLKSPELFIYERDATRYVVVDFRDGGEVHVGQKEVERREMEARVTVHSSLWNAMKGAGVDPSLAITLSEIYAWTIDFHGIVKGDSIRVLYEQWFVEGEPLGHFEVKGAIFTHAGKPYPAILYPRDNRLGYFDERGNSLQKAFLKAPLRYSRISSRFSNSRYHPVLKINRPHHGVDYAAPVGTPVYSIGDGTVTRRAFQQDGGGNFVTIRHNSVYSTTYMHLSRFATGIRVGGRVAQGEVIGYVGSSGLSTGPHLDFRVFRNGAPINPLAMESPSLEPVAREHLEHYLHVKDSILGRLACP